MELSVRTERSRKGNVGTNALAGKRGFVQPRESHTHATPQDRFIVDSTIRCRTENTDCFEHIALAHAVCSDEAVHTTKVERFVRN